MKAELPQSRQMENCPQASGNAPHDVRHSKYYFSLCLTMTPRVWNIFATHQSQLKTPHAGVNPFILFASTPGLLKVWRGSAEAHHNPQLQNHLSNIMTLLPAVSSVNNIKLHAKGKDKKGHERPPTFLQPFDRDLACWSLFSKVAFDSVFKECTALVHSSYTCACTWHAIVVCEYIDALRR